MLKQWTLESVQRSGHLLAGFSDDLRADPEVAKAAVN
jgi:hypothetical protein